MIVFICASRMGKSSERNEFVKSSLQLLALSLMGLERGVLEVCEHDGSRSSVVDQVFDHAGEQTGTVGRRGT